MIVPNARKQAIGVVKMLALAASISAAVSCADQVGAKPSQPADMPAGAVRFESKESLGPDANPGAEATLAMAGVEIPVDLVHRSEGGRVSISLKAHGEVIEDEIYDSPAAGFGLASAAGEEYAPPIPLLQFPLRAGEAWEWSGTMSAGGVSRKAKAKVRADAAPLNEESGSDDAVRVTVELAMEGGGPDPAMRKLTFWFLPGRGLVQREFGVGSSRRPGHPEPPVEETESE